MLKVTVTYAGVPFQHITEARGHKVTGDLDTSQKGGNTGLTPHEQFLGSLGQCTAMTIEVYAGMKKWTIPGMTVTVTEDKIDDPNNAGTQIPHIEIEVSIDGGDSLTDEQIAKLKEKGENCPIKKLVMNPKVIDLKVSRTPASS